MTPEAIALIEEHHSLIEPVTRQVTSGISYPLDFEELKSLAACALVDAAERWPRYCEKNGFDPGALEYFVAYARRRMRGAILDSLRSADWVKRQARTNAKRLRDVGMGTGVSDQELARRSGMSIGDVRATLQAVANTPVSFDYDPNGNLLGSVTTPQDVDGTAFERAATGTLVRAMEKLDKQTRVVLVLHYFLGEELQVVAALMSITESRASMLHSEGVLAVLSSLRELASERVLEPAC